MTIPLRNVPVHAFIVSALVVGLLWPNLSHTLEIGMVARDITPDVEQYRVPLAGYGARVGKPATGIHDPIKGKAIYFRDGDREMAIITLDLRSVTPELKAKIIEKCGDDGLRADNVLVCASHTHAGPSFYAEGFWQWQFGKHDPEIVENMAATLADALRTAKANARPAKVGFGSGLVEGFTANRRWGYDTEAREAAGERPSVNPRLWVMRVDSLEGEMVGLLVNFATHPTIMGADNMLISAEWPGVLQSRLEEGNPGTVVLYSNGAEGDQRPVGAQGEGFERVKDFGMRLADEVAKIALRVETRENLSIDYLHIAPSLPDLAFTEPAKKRYPEMEDAAREALPSRAEIQLFRIGGTILVGLPGEAISDVGLDIESRLRGVGFHEVVIVGLANDYVGYILNEEEYGHGGYEVDSRSFYGPGLGRFIAAATHRAATVWGVGEKLGARISKGAEVLFNGSDFEGWKLFVPDSEIDPSTVWSTQDGTILCVGKPSGYLRTTTSYSNYRLVFEWRWPESTGGNSGVLLHVSESDTVWPKSIEGQLQHRNAADIWVIGGTDFKEHVDKNNRRVKKRHASNEAPLGQWNVFEAVCAGNTISLYVNGVLQNVATETTVSGGFIGFQSEGTPVEFRNILLEPLGGGLSDADAQTPGAGATG